MASVLYNYSSLMQRDTKIYAIGGVGMPSGLSVTFTKVVVPCAIATMLLGTVVSWFFGVNMWNPFGGAWNWKYLLTWTVLGAAIGLCLWNIQFSGYRLYQYLGAYFKPKKVYTNEQDVRKRIFKLTNVKVDTLFRQIL